jgi:hypothetical protein
MDDRFARAEVRRCCQPWWRSVDGWRLALALITQREHSAKHLPESIQPVTNVMHRLRHFDLELEELK